MSGQLGRNPQGGSGGGQGDPPPGPNQNQPPPPDEERPLKSSWLELFDKAKSEVKGDKGICLEMFDACLPNNLHTWLHSICQYAAMQGWKKGELLITLAMSNMTYDTQKLLTSKLVMAHGYDFDAFEKELLAQFPET